MNDVPTASERICRFAEELSFEDIPAEVTGKAKLLTLDLFGIALAARADPIDMPLRAAARALAGKGKKRPPRPTTGTAAPSARKSGCPRQALLF